jgi:hypothetical protein
MPMMWGGGGGLGAHPEDVPQVGEPQEKELCAGPPPLLAMTMDQVEAAHQNKDQDGCHVIPPLKIQHDEFHCSQFLIMLHP